MGKMQKNRYRIQHHQAILVVLFCLIGLTACAPSLSASEVTGTPVFYRPAPPLDATPTPNENPQDLSRPLSTPVCIDNLTYLSDVTIPDGTEVQPNATMDKRWEVKNSGNCNWDDRYRLRLIAGPDMGSPKEQALYPARSGSQVVLQIIFQAPTDPGSYRSAWQAYNSDGQPFGDPFFIDIMVK